MEPVTRGFNFFMIIEISSSLFEFIMKSILIICMVLATMLLGFMIIHSIRIKDGFSAIVFSIMFVTGIFCIGCISEFITIKFV